MNFFLDNNLSIKLAKAMNHLEQEGEVMHLTEKFPADAKDEEWLKYVGENGIILITQDQKIRRRAAEKAAFKTHKVGAFVLVGKNRDRWQIINQLIKNWLKIKELAAKTKRPFAFKVPIRGKIEQLHL